jgi:hypothetical protein
VSAYDAAWNGNRDVFVAKLNAAGNALFYSTYLGGGSHDYGFGLAIDGIGNAYVTGYTESSAFPTTAGAYDTSYNTGSDVFVTVLNAAGNALLCSTFLGGTGGEVGYEAAVDIYGDVYVSGTTTSTNFPCTTDTYDNTYNGGLMDVFVAMFNPTLSSLAISTFLGGSGADRCNGLALDASRDIYVTGYTDSANFPTTAGAFDTGHNGDYDVFVTKLNEFGMISTIRRTSEEPAMTAAPGSPLMRVRMPM